MHEPDPWAVAVIASLGDERARRALSARDIERMRLAGGRPLPPVLRATLQRRGPRWGMPGQWARGKPSSFQAARIDALVRRLVEKDDFHPQHHWDLAALAERLPGECHALDLDPPYAFLYVAEDAPRDDQADHPVFVWRLTS